MKNIQYILLLILMLFSSKEILAQKDSIALQRKARKLLREGNELYNKKQYTDASVAYQKSLGQNTKYGKASYNLGNALYQNKNYKEAVPQYELTAQTAKDKFTKAEAYHNIGNAMMEQKQYQPAVDAYKNSLRNNPNDDETRYNLAVAQKLLDKEKQDNKDNKITRITRIKTTKTKTKIKIRRTETIRTKRIKTKIKKTKTRKIRARKTRIKILKITRIKTNQNLSHNKEK